MPLRNVTTICVVALISLICHQKAARNRYAGLVAEGMAKISRNYVQPVERRELFEGAMEGMVRHLDPYSEFISPDRYARFQESLQQEFGGVGIAIEMNPQTERLTVVTPLVGTPAFAAGLLPGDVILKIDEHDTSGMSTDDAVRRMRGPVGSTVRLTIGRADGDPRELVIERARIHVESVLGDFRNPDGSWRFVLKDAPSIGYVRIHQFGDASDQELRDALQQLPPGITGLILDLRDNPGGLLDKAVTMADYFLDEGTIVTTRGRDTEQVLDSFRASPTNTIFPMEIPVCVLVNRFSASASEIVAACLQDHGRATIIGERTWGKGTVQNIIPMEGNKSALRLTTATYWRPSGANIHRLPEAEESDDWGVRPAAENLVMLTDDQRKEVAELRRQRDIVQGPGQVDASSTQRTSLDVDPQLRRAVETLRSGIGFQPVVNCSGIGFQPVVNCSGIGFQPVMNCAVG